MSNKHLALGLALILVPITAADSVFQGKSAFQGKEVVAKKVVTVPTLGKKAPRFRLNDHLGRVVRVGGRSRTKSWTVIAFYPKAATPG